MQKNRSAHSEQVVANEKNLEKEAKDQERELARKSKEYSQQLDQEKNPAKQKDKKKKQSKVQEIVGKVPTSEVSYKLFHTPRIERNIRSQIEAVIDSKLRDNSMAMVWKDSISHVAFYSGGSKIQSFWSDFEKDQTPEAKNATMKKHMTLVFQSAYFSLEMISDYMSKADRFVMAQKISDIMLNELSPVASSSKYADYSKNYFIRYPDHKFIGERDGSVEEILQALTEAGKTLGSEQPKLNTALIEEVAAHKKATSTMTRLGRSNEEICSDYIDDKKLSEQVKVQLSGILKNAKVDEDIVAYMKERMESCLMEVCEEIDKIKYDETKKKEMAGHARGMFSAAYGTLKEKWAFKDTAERIVAAQQIADLYLKNYSPAAFRKELAGDFMNNCVLGNKEFLMEDLGYYEEGNYDTPEEYEAFITEVYEANNSGKFKIDVSKDVNEKTTGEVSPRVESIKPATKEKTFN